MIKFIKDKVVDGNPIHSVAGAALIVSITGILSRILGLFRDRILASTFGAGDALDVYYAAFRLPDLLYNLLIVGALSAAFIPVFTGLIAKKKEKEAWKLVNGMLTSEVITLMVISFFLVIFAPQVMRLITPGFSEEKLIEVSKFTRIMFLSPIFLGISAIFGGVLVSFKRFFAYSMAPIFYNIGIIIGAIFFVRWWGIVGLSWGVVLGAFLHMLTQIPSIKSAGFKYKFRIGRFSNDKNLKKVFHLMIPRSLSMGVSQINLLVITVFASTLTSGSLSAFNFANNLQSVPLGLFGVSFAVAAFPILSSAIAEDDHKKFVHTFSRTFRRILFFVVPSSVFIFTLRAEIVRAVFGSGEFDWEDTRTTLLVLGFLSISLFAQSLIPLLARSFYALEDTKTPFVIALFSEAINIASVFFLVKTFQITGLAMAFSLSTIINMFLLYYFLRVRFRGSMDDKNIIVSATKVVIGSLFSGFVIYLTRHMLESFVDMNTFAEVIFQLVVSGLSGVCGFILVCYWLNIKEFHEFKTSILIRVFGSGNMENKG